MLHDYSYLSNYDIFTAFEFILMNQSVNFTLCSSRKLKISNACTWCDVEMPIINFTIKFVISLSNLECKYRNIRN